MTFIEAFDKIKASLKGAKANGISGHLAIQINLNNQDSSGIFYIEINDGNVYVEPFDYYDRDAMFIVSCEDFIDIMTDKKDFEKAIADGTLVIEGNFERALEMKKLVIKEKKSTTKKSATKKSAEKKTAEKKTAEKKTAEKKTAEKKTAEKKTAEKKTTEEKPSTKKDSATKEEKAETKPKKSSKKASEKESSSDKKITKK